MILDLTEGSFHELPIEPDDGFPQAFLLSLDGILYRLTFSISFLTLEPFKLWNAGAGPTAERAVKRSLSFPLSTSGARVRLPWDLQSEPERMIYVLPQDSLYLVVKLEREDLPENERLLGITRPMLNVPVLVGNLVFWFRTIHIARGNLLGAGDYGSNIEAGVMTYGG